MFENYQLNTKHPIEEKLKEKLNGDYLDSIICLSKALRTEIECKEIFLIFA